MLMRRALSFVFLAPNDGGNADPPAGGGGGGGGKTDPPPKADPPKADDVAALKAQLAAFEKREADRVAAETAAKKKADEDALTAAGKHQELVALKDKEIEALKATAGVAQQFIEAESKRIDGLKGSLTPAQQALVDGETNILRRGQIVNEFLALKSAGGGGGGPGGSPPPPGDKPDVEKLLKSGMTAEQIQQKHPEEYAAYAASFLPQSRTTSFARGLHSSTNGKKG